MPRYEKIRKNLYGVELHYGKLELKPGHNFSCFFIVEHTKDREYIRAQALELRLAGCQKYDFYGAVEPLWHFAVDEVNAMLHPNCSPEEAVFITKWDTLEDFISTLHSAISFRPFIPYDAYLIYDEAELYREVVRRLEG